MVHHTIFSPSIIFAIEQWGRVCEAPSCEVGGAAIESFQGVNLLSKRSALIPIEETYPLEQEPGSCKLLLSKDTNTY